MQCCCLQPWPTCAELAYRIVSWRWLYIRYSSVTIACMGLQPLWKIVFFPWPKVGRWLSGIDGTVGPPQQQLGFLFYKTQVAFMYVYGYGEVCTTLLARGYVHYWKRRRRSRRFWNALLLYFLLAFKMLVRKKACVIFLLINNKNTNKLTNPDRYFTKPTALKH